MGKRNSEAVTRSKKRKEARRAKKQRRSDFYASRRNFNGEAKLDHHGEIGAKVQISGALHEVPLEKPTLKSSFLKVRSDDASDHKTRNALEPSFERRVKRVHWCPSVAPARNEDSNSDSEWEAANPVMKSSTSRSDTNEFQRHRSLPISPQKHQLVVRQPPDPQKDVIFDYHNDQEVAYVEKQLGLRNSDRKKNRAKLFKELATLDGLDDDLIEFTELCLESGNVDTEVKQTRREQLACSEDFSQNNTSNSDEIIAVGQHDSNSAERLTDVDSDADYCRIQSTSNFVTSDSECDEKNGDHDNDAKKKKREHRNDESNDEFSDQDSDSFVASETEDNEVAYLRKQLGLQGCRKKKNKLRLMKELELLDGLDPDLLLLADHCLKSDCKELCGKMKNDKKTVKRVGHEGQNEKPFCNERREADSGDAVGVSERPASKGNVIEGIMGGNNEKNLSKDRKAAATAIGKYVPPALRKTQTVGVLECVLDTTSRKKLSKAEARAISFALTKVKKQMTGFVNRISDGNLAPITAQISEEIFHRAHSLAREHLQEISNLRKDESVNSSLTSPHKLSIGGSASLLSELSERFSRQVVSASVENLSSTVSLIACQVACIAGLSARVSYRICQYYIIALVKSFERNWTTMQELLSASPRPETTIDDNNLQTARTAIAIEDDDELATKISTIRSYLRFVVMSLSLLFDFGLLDASAIFSFLRRLFENFSNSGSFNPQLPELEISVSPALFETQVDLVLACLQYTSHRLRSQFALDFKDILTFVSSTIEAFETQCKKLHGQKKIQTNNRLSYLLREMEDLRNGKLNVQLNDRFQFIRYWLSNGTDFDGVEWGKLMFSLSSISNEAIERGSVVAWYSVANDELKPECPIERFEKHLDTQKIEAKSRIDGVNNEKIKLLRKAEEQRLHTDLQKGIFVALMGAEDPQHAVQRVLEVAHQKHEASHVVAVTMHTSLRQRLFNPFFGHVLFELCSLPSAYGKRFKRALKQGIAAQLSICHKFPLLNLLNFAKLISYLCLNTGGVIELRIIRFIDREAIYDQENGLSGSLGLFLRQICIEFCKIDSSIIEEMGPIDIDLFESQVQGIVPMNDLASHLSLILHSLVLPELKTNESEGLALNRAKQFLSILSHSC